MTFPIFVCDMANSHMGDVEIGKGIIDAVVSGGADAIKFQYRDPSILHPTIETKHHKRFKETHLEDSERLELVEYAKDVGLTVVCTPFDEPSVDMCTRHDVDVIKVASCSADDWPLLEKIAATGYPVIVSTGGLQWDEIDNLYSFLKNRHVEFAIMHCVAMYPTPHYKANLGVITKMKRRYDVPIGYSGHEDDPLVCPVAIGKGAEIIERHVSLSEVYQNAYSLFDADGVKSWVADCTRAFVMCGNNVTSTEEAESLKDLKRGHYGELGYRMPMGALSAGQHHSRIDPETRLVRDVVHEYEGMFREAGIPMNGERELSHHFGKTMIRQFGALFITVINREYAKKLIGLLPNQAHPEHFHKKKAETFQVLHGVLDVGLGKAVKQLFPGDTLDVPCGVAHWFSSPTGCVFEEVSTHAERVDSFYTDDWIQSVDPMLRKTLIEE